MYGNVYNQDRILEAVFDNYNTDVFKGIFQSFLDLDASHKTTPPTRGEHMKSESCEWNSDIRSKMDDKRKWRYAWDLIRSHKTARSNIRH
jgi:hypothetical protein